MQKLDLLDGLRFEAFDKGTISSLMVDILRNNGWGRSKGLIWSMHEFTIGNQVKRFNEVISRTKNELSKLVKSYSGKISSNENQTVFNFDGIGGSTYKYTVNSISCLLTTRKSGDGEYWSANAVIYNDKQM